LRETYDYFESIRRLDKFYELVAPKIITEIPTIELSRLVSRTPGIARFLSSQSDLLPNIMESYDVDSMITY